MSIDPVVLFVSRDVESTKKIVGELRGVVQASLGPLGIPSGLEVLPFVSSAGLRHELGRYRSLRGLVIDAAFFVDKSPEVREQIADFERLGVPLFRFQETYLTGDSQDRLLFKKKWEAFVRQVAAYHPRGLRTADRKMCFARVQWQGGMPASFQENLNFSTGERNRVVTFDLSPGGCFLVLCDHAMKTGDELTLSFEEHAVPVKARVCWLNPWDGLKGRMPGVGVEFVTPPESFGRYVASLLGERNS
jgi:hypothetical protein